MDKKNVNKEIETLDLLLQNGVMVKFPKSTAKNKANLRQKRFLNKLYHASVNNGSTLVKMDENEIIVRIYPLVLGTIDCIRRRLLNIEQVCPDFRRKAENGDSEVLQYGRDLCEIIAIATLNCTDTWKCHREIRRYAEFFYANLTPLRMLKVVQAIVAMTDSSSFCYSILLMLGVSQTSGASRIEKQE